MTGQLCLLSVALLVLACGSPTPPQPTNRPIDGQPSGSPPDLDAGLDLLAPAGLPALAGIYLPEGVVGRGNDHYAFIQSPTDCDTLAAVLGAGEWTIAERVAMAVPSPDPSAGLPPFALPEWLLLRWGGNAAVVRMGGNSSGCVAQIWRLARLPYRATGAIESSGEAMAFSISCLAGAGAAELNSMYFADDGTAFSLHLPVPLKVGRHAVDADTEIRIGRVELDEVFRAFAVQEGDSGFDEETLEAFYPADLESGQWQGRVEVTSLEPLTGEVVLEDVRDEGGRRTLSLQTGFRCDLPPGQLTRAAESTPIPNPSFIPGSVTVEVSTGPHAGRHEISSQKVACSYNLSGDKQWLTSYSPEEPPPAGELQSMLITTTPGAKASVFMIFGDDPSRDWINGEAATAKVTDSGATVELDVNGRVGGVAFDVALTCHDIARF